MLGILYGIGTGPGDPELMTMKAVRIIKECDVIALPISNRQAVTEPVVLEAGTCSDEILKGCAAYQIALPNVPEMKKKPVLLTPMPMCKDKAELKAIHDASADKAEELIKEGKKIAFLTLGDPTVYSTYLYLHKRMVKRGLPAQIISGVPSFCASAARMGTGLVENKQQLHILPSSYGVEQGIKLSGTKVLMKAGKKMGQIKEEIKNHRQQFYMVENCGMENEAVYREIEQVPEHASYYSLIVLKEDK
ncbi:precorrin-2 C(20)-methyltransferase [[Clostridium] polysaccharolyticum]|uniref:Precorrin-2 C20-methyltransferase n=1 Tax=[Clostridium] polysaccharolyticum TaxID=29364 RepID=A0A1H9Y4E3_9FIRM|nr:precorrin-2 C(20)-methyltransferase [[Clostridium] polysaccharolyticum]SES63695.1 precorrin-2 C20-methyltransferase [[Clostridium] polysaccharolyticum]